MNSRTITLLVGASLGFILWGTVKGAAIGFVIAVIVLLVLSPVL